MPNSLQSALFGLPPDTSVTTLATSVSVTPTQFDYFYSQLDQVFGGDKLAARKAANRLSQKLQANHITDAATGAPFTLQMCELYAEYGPDLDAARATYNQRTSEGSTAQ